MVKAELPVDGNNLSSLKQCTTFKLAPTPKILLHFYQNHPSKHTFSPTYCVRTYRKIGNISNPRFRIGLCKAKNVFIG